eukprot:gnl/Hemi2/25615_TR8607_c0_g1_i2.p1 gnl/Hemi2/25615_TR8607_c0_g1~~gnl/Hemi2/25615_TR8607_c0_g1_i2.p1  ORF type:complete len:665 (+),score=146.60 gnl/Hemi2/25615_TR8607_c0_g1_i2:78-2072(+)
MEVHRVFGVCSMRHGSCIHGEEDEIFTPLNSCIVKWRVNAAKMEAERTFITQCHKDIVTSVRQSPSGLIVTTSFGGEVAVWDRSWNCLARRKALRAIADFALWSPDSKRLAVTSYHEGGELVVLDHNLETHALTEIGRAPTANIFLEWTDDGKVFAINERSEQKLPVRLCLFTLLDGQAPILHQELVLATDHCYSCSRLAGTHRVALGCHNREVIVVDIANLQVVNTVPAVGSGILRTLCWWDEQSVLVAGDNGKCKVWNLAGESLLEFGAPDSVDYLSWIGSPACRTVWIGGDGNLSQVLIENGLSKHRHDTSLFNFTCCGIASSPDGRYIVTGDFASQVYLFDSHASGRHGIQPLKQSMVPDSVRCLAWHDESSGVQIGCLDGSCLWWHHTATGEEELQLICKLDAGITCMSWQHGGGNSLAIATTNGVLAVFALNKDAATGLLSWAQTLKFTAHDIIPGSDSSTKHYTEVWSVAWSPANDLLATASEDQTTCIWNAHGEKLQTLTGHTSAVTSVDWQRTAVGEVLATCGDDHFLHVWRRGFGGADENIFPDPKPFCVFDSSPHIAQWHTLTYLALEEGGSRVACATENGFVLVWRIDTGELISCGRSHAGSIEGLAWRTLPPPPDCCGEENASSSSPPSDVIILATCGSDCSVNLHTLLPL